MIRNFILAITAFVFINTAISAKPTVEKSRLVGNLIKSALETYHYKKMTIDDSVSEKAFEKFLERIDYRKEFLLKGDVDHLRRHQFKIDDQVVSGEHTLLLEALDVYKKRLSFVKKYIDKAFKKGFDFSKKEYIEFDPEKRDFPKNEKQLAEVWRKTLKQATLTRYLDLKEDRDDPVDESEGTAKERKKKKKKQKELSKKTDKELLKQALEKTQEKYAKYIQRLQDQDDEEELEMVFNAIASIYDPHTVYLPPRKKEDFDIDISGSLEGIGAVLQEDGSYIKVVRIVPGGAAWRQKELEVDDMILAVAEGKKGEWVDLIDMRVDDAVRYIRGPKDTVVKLSVKKVDGSKKVINIKRDVVKIGASFAKSSVIEHKQLGKKIGYIYVPKFYRDFGDGNKRNCSRDVKIELERLNKFGVEGVILDLRNNGGGALEDAKLMSGLFIEKGPIVQVKHHNDRIDVLTDTDKSVTYDGPLMVMINRFSASASEIVAGALQDYGRAVVVGGEHSHGKGTVQAVVNLNQGPLLSMFGPTMGALKVTIQKFYRVNGHSTQYKGITPDIILPDPTGYAKNREQDLDYSLPWDKVKPLNYSPWEKQSYNLGLLRKRSSKRIKKNDRFKKIEDYVSYLIRKREDTKVPLSEKELMKQDEENEKMAEKYKIDEENKEIKVSHFEESLKTAEEIKPGDEEKWKEEFKQRKEEWVSSIQKDVMLEEALFIMDDMVSEVKGQKYSLVK